MIEEMKKMSLNFDNRRVGRFMRENGIRVEQSEQYKLTTERNDVFNITLDLLNQNFRTDQQNQKSAGDIGYGWARGGWLNLPVNFNCIPGG